MAVKKKPARKKRLSPKERARVDDLFLRFSTLSDNPKTELNFDSPFTRSTFGDVFVDNFLIMQRREAAEFAEHGHSAPDEVSDWEITRYRGVI